jgi:phenylalanyl-tRNA synthetase beta chain
VWIGELWLDRLYRQGLRRPVVQELSRFQPVRRDFSVVLPDSVAYAKVVDALQNLAIPELQRIEPKEVLRSKMVAAGHYSLLLGVVFQSHERTLREEEVQRWSQQVIAALEAAGGKLRG